jgi:hypothetical protein
MTKTAVYDIVFLWLAWLLIILGFQWVVTTRLELKHPDLAVFWSRTETLRTIYESTGRLGFGILRWHRSRWL